MLRIHFYLAVLFLSHAIQAAENSFGEQVPKELAETFSGGIIQPGLPADFPTAPFTDPVSLRVIGSLDRGFRQQVLVSTPDEINTVRSAFHNAYSTVGWLTLFESGKHIQLCHDELGRLSLDFSENSNTENRISVDFQNIPAGAVYGGLNCAQQRERIQSGTTRGDFISSLMPELAFPDQAVNQHSLLSPLWAGVSRISLSSGEFEIHRQGRLQTPGMDLSSLYTHFAVQLVNQDWTVDSNATGHESASSVWFRTVDGPGVDADGTGEALQLTGIMVILDKGKDTYSFSFRLQGEGDYGGMANNIHGPSVNVSGLGIRGISPMFP